MIALVSCAGGEIAVTLRLSDADATCDPTVLADVESAEVIVSHRGGTERACVSVGTIDSIGALEGALAASGLRFELEGGEGNIEVRGYEDAGCVDIELCGSADYQLPGNAEIEIPVRCPCP